MNDLLKEASKQAILERISSMWLSGKGNQRKSRREPQRALAGDFYRYLTDVYGSNCEILDDYDWNLMPFKWRNKSKLDLDQFKADCEEIDRG